MVHYWKITSDSIKRKFKNETTRRINRNLWNNLTIDANMQMDFKIVKHSYESDIAYTCYVWDYWISCIPARAQLEQINEIVSAVLNSTLGPKKTVKRLNRHFQTMSWFSMFSRASLFVSIHAVKFTKTSFLLFGINFNNCQSFIIYGELFKSIIDFHAIVSQNRRHILLRMCFVVCLCEAYRSICEIFSWHWSWICWNILYYPIYYTCLSHTWILSSVLLRHYKEGCML